MEYTRRYLRPEKLFKPISKESEYLRINYEYLITRETKDHYVIDVGYGEEKVRKNELNLNYVIVYYRD